MSSRFESIELLGDPNFENLIKDLDTITHFSLFFGYLLSPNLALYLWFGVASREYIVKKAFSMMNGAAFLKQSRLCRTDACLIGGEGEFFTSCYFDLIELG